MRIWNLKWKKLGAYTLFTVESGWLKFFYHHFSKQSYHYFKFFGLYDYSIFPVPKKDQSFFSETMTNSPEPSTMAQVYGFEGSLIR